MQGKDCKISIRVSEEKKHKLVSSAEKAGQSLSAYIISCVDNNHKVTIASKGPIYHKLQCITSLTDDERIHRLADKIAKEVEEM